MKNMPTWAAAVALAAAVTTTTSAFGQADLQLRQAKEREAAEKREQKEANKAEQRADKQERQQIKKEREQLENMPQAARRVLKAETEGASNIDYFKVPAENKEQNTFGATFTKASDGHHYDIRVDRQGNVIGRTDITALHAAQAAGQAPATPAPATPAPTPPVANAPTTPAPVPAPTAPTASREAPKSGDPVYRRLQANEVPANIRTVLD